MNLHATIRTYIAAHNTPGLCLVYVPQGLDLGHNLAGQPYTEFLIPENAMHAKKDLREIRQECVDAKGMWPLFIRKHPAGTILDSEADLVLSVGFNMNGGSVTVHKSRGFVTDMPDTSFTYEA